MKNSFMDWIQSIQKGLKKNFHQTTPQQDHRNLIWLNFRLSSTAIGLLNRHDFDVLGACGWFFNSREMRWCPDLLRLPRHCCLSFFLEVKQKTCPKPQYFRQNLPFFFYVFFFGIRALCTVSPYRFALGDFGFLGETSSWLVFRS